MVAKNVIFIPGTNIPFMGRVRFGATEETAAAGINARIKNTTAATAAVNSAMTRGIASVVGATGIAFNAAMAASAKGLAKGVMFLDKDIKTTPPTVPMSPSPDGGNLRSSWVNESVDRPGYEFAVLAGFTADYAVYVHEMTDEAYGKKINWTEPGSGPKFLEYGLKRNVDVIVGMVVREVRKVTR